MSVNTLFEIKPNGDIKDKITMLKAAIKDYSSSDREGIMYALYYMLARPAEKFEEEGKVEDWKNGIWKKRDVCKELLTLLAVPEVAEINKKMFPRQEQLSQHLLSMLEFFETFYNDEKMQAEMHFYELDQIPYFYERGEKDIDTLEMEFRSLIAAQEIDDQVLGRKK